MNVLKALEEVAAWTVGQVGFFCRQDVIYSAVRLGLPALDGTIGEIARRSCPDNPWHFFYRLPFTNRSS